MHKEKSARLHSNARSHLYAYVSELKYEKNPKIYIYIYTFSHSGPRNKPRSWRVNFRKQNQKKKLMRQERNAACKILLTWRATAAAAGIWNARLWLLSCFFYFDCRARVDSTRGNHHIYTRSRVFLLYVKIKHRRYARDWRDESNDIRFCSNESYIFIFCSAFDHWHRDRIFMYGRLVRSNVITTICYAFDRTAARDDKIYYEKSSRCSHDRESRYIHITHVGAMADNPL